jgi:hypothetical protein
MMTLTDTSFAPSQPARQSDAAAAASEAHDFLIKIFTAALIGSSVN